MLSLENSSTLRQYNKINLEQFSKLWKAEAYSRKEPDRQTINIVFSELELSSSIIQPILKLEINVNHYDYYHSLIRFN